MIKQKENLKALSTQNNTTITGYFKVLLRNTNVHVARGLKCNFLAGLFSQNSQYKN